MGYRKEDNFQHPPRRLPWIPACHTTWWRFFVLTMSQDIYWRSLCIWPLRWWPLQASFLFHISWHPSWQKSDWSHMCPPIFSGWQLFPQHYCLFHQQPPRKHEDGQSNIWGRHLSSLCPMHACKESPGSRNWIGLKVWKKKVLHNINPVKVFITDGDDSKVGCEVDKCLKRVEEKEGYPNPDDTSMKQFARWQEVVPIQQVSIKTKFK